MLSTVDTLAVSKGFVDVGFTQAQAEKMAITYKNMKEGLATKEDLEHVKETLEQKIEHVEQLLDSRIKTLFWMFGLGFVTIGGLLTAIITILINL